MGPWPPNPLIGRALRIAAEWLGVDELAGRLGCSVTSVAAWQDGAASMPKETFLQLVDVLLEIDPSWLDDKLMDVVTF